MNEIDLLSHVYHTAQMGPDAITSARRYSPAPPLPQALPRQKHN